MCNHHFITNRTNRKANNNFFITIISFGVYSTADPVITCPKVSLLSNAISFITPHTPGLAPDNPVILLDEL